MKEDKVIKDPTTMAYGVDTSKMCTYRVSNINEGLVGYFKALDESHVAQCMSISKDKFLNGYDCFSIENVELFAQVISFSDAEMEEERFELVTKGAVRKIYKVISEDNLIEKRKKKLQKMIEKSDFTAEEIMRLLS